MNRARKFQRKRQGRLRQRQDGGVVQITQARQIDVAHRDRFRLIGDDPEGEVQT